MKDYGITRRHGASELDIVGIPILTVWFLNLPYFSNKKHIVKKVIGRKLSSHYILIRTFWGLCKQEQFEIASVK